ncbi:hypothetical protein BDW22DRAFT_973721 [Trametopsis cervina]|nr:hypothetical protein BDW22DRAFT_973721 [Trametopsis cervina]
MSTQRHLHVYGQQIHERERLKYSQFTNASRRVDTRSRQGPAAQRFFVRLEDRTYQLIRPLLSGQRAGCGWISQHARRSPLRCKELGQDNTRRLVARMLRCSRMDRTTGATEAWVPVLILCASGGLGSECHHMRHEVRYGERECGDTHRAKSRKCCCDHTYGEAHCAT